MDCFRCSVWPNWQVLLVSSSVLSLRVIQRCARATSPHCNARPTLFQSWASVLDAGPALKQRWLIVSFGNVIESDRSIGDDCPILPSGTRTAQPHYPPGSSIHSQSYRAYGCLGSMATARLLDDKLWRVVKTSRISGDVKVISGDNFVTLGRPGIVS